MLQSRRVSITLLAWLALAVIAAPVVPPDSTVWWWLVAPPAVGLLAVGVGVIVAAGIAWAGYLMRQ